MIQYFDAPYILTVIGIGYFITQSELAKPIRESVSSFNQKDLKQPHKWIVNKFDGVINCIYCASFWIGIFVYLIKFQELSINTALYAFSAMGAIYIIKNIFKN